MEGRFDELLLGLAKQHTDGVPGVRIAITKSFSLNVMFKFFSLSVAEHNCRIPVQTYRFFHRL